MATYRLFPSTTPSAGTFSAAGNFYTLGLEFKTAGKCWLTQVWYYRPTTATSSTAPVSVWTVAAGGTTGTLVTSSNVSFAAGASTGWVSRTYATPIALAAGSYRVGVYYSNTLFAYGAALGSDVVSGPLTAPSHANALGTRQGPIHGPTATGVGITFPEADGNQFYGADVTVTDVDPTSASQTSFFPFLGP